MAWTEEMVADLSKMWDEGLTANEIAKRLGVSKNSIVGKVHRLCLTARPSPIKKKTPIADIDTAEIVENNDIVIKEKDVEVDEVSLVASDNKQKSKHVSTNVKLVQLDSHTCRWPIGDPRDDDFCFCGKKVRMGQTYCDEHSAMAYVKATKK